MDSKQTQRIENAIPSLRRAEHGLQLRARIEQGRVVFSGGMQGEASIGLDVSSLARVLAHWDGYCVANGCRSQPLEGERVTFQRGMFGTWHGRVVRACATSVVVSYTRSNGTKAERRVPVAHVQF